MSDSYDAEKLYVSLVYLELLQFNFFYGNL